MKSKLTDIVVSCALGLTLGAVSRLSSNEYHPFPYLSGFLLSGSSGNIKPFLEKRKQHQLEESLVALGSYMIGYGLTNYLLK